MTKLEMIEEWFEHAKSIQQDKYKKHNGMFEWDCGYDACLNEIERILKDKKERGYE